ncbi:hypothetical protein NQ315_011162 [Exocentrus adspersus]|uniref:Transport and Golgi organization protein 1 n=1 Tax=Exocentrus adspersus TaxID=1586481 RepID=A0AAV8VXK4_9CUCU|nr:hypothetical protein NQ315_011162 [Exocentrus adspersus]
MDTGARSHQSQAAKVYAKATDHENPLLRAAEDYVPECAAQTVKATAAGSRVRITKTKSDSYVSEPVSLAKTLLRYSSPDPRILSFAPNVEVTIYSKEAGSETNLWGASINGKRGYVPKHLVRESKIYKKPTLLVDTELKQKPVVPKGADKNSIDPHNVKEPFEVIDGTTIFLNPQDSVNVKPSSTEAPILSTSLPPGPGNHRSNENTPSVENLKEDTLKTDKTEESLVNNVLSSFTGWMDDDPDSEEVEVEEDDDDDNEDEDDDEEESVEEDNKKAEEVAKTVDINSLHNLPAGIKISPYSLEVNQSSQQEAPETDSFSLPEVEVDSFKEAQDINTATVEVKSKGDLAAEKDNPPSTENTESTDAPEEEKVVITTDNIKIEPAPSSEIGDEPPAKINNKQTVEAVVSNSLKDAEVNSINNEQVNQETTNPVDIAPEDASKLVTDPATTEEQLLQEGTTKPFMSAEEVTDQNVPELSNVTAPSENIEGKENGEMNSVTVDELNNLELMTSEEPTNPGNSVVGSNPIAEKENLEVTTDSFIATQNIPFEENSEQENKEGMADSIKFSEVPTESADEVQESVTNQIFEASKENTPNMEEHYTEQSLFMKDVPSSIEVQEIIESDLDGNIITENEDASNKEPNIEEVNNIQENSSEGDVKSTVEELTEGTPEDSGLWSGILSYFTGSSDKPASSSDEQESAGGILGNNNLASQEHKTVVSSENYCEATSELCNTSEAEKKTSQEVVFDIFNMNFNSDFFLLLVTTAGSVIVFLFIYMALDRHKREAPLVARINKLEKELLVTLKENEVLQETSTLVVPEVESVPSGIVEQLTQSLADAQLSHQILEQKVAYLETQLESKAALEEQIENLEKELETSTEVGMELNRIISEMLDPTNGSDRLKENVEQLQRQLLEQKDTINSINKTLQEKEAENRLLRGDLERSRKATTELQTKVDEMVEKILKIEKEKDQQQNILQNEITVYQQKYNEVATKEELLNNEIQVLRVQISESQRQADIKTKEFQLLKESLDKMRSLKGDGDALKALLDSTSIKAEIQQLKTENATYAAQLQQEQAVKVGFEKKYQSVTEENRLLKEKYEQADKEKVEINSKLEVLNNYFKKRESELQEEIIRYKSIWDVKEGEAASTTERIRYMQEEIDNYKAQNETLKQEIISQEIDLKSQISMLEKKVHENWVTTRQMERRLEDARQEAAQLRNRLTLRERAINEERIHNRLQSPVEQNGELPLSPHPIDSPASPPLLYGARDHITKSPPLPGLPPFLPPPPGAPFMPPPLHGMPPFMPPPPSMFPGDHRPPPLGRMSSPPLNSRYSPDTSAFSPYERNSPSPPYDSEYGASPPPIRGYSPYNSRNDRRDYKRPTHIRSNGRNVKGMDTN